jgi:hypothetical protein
LTNFELDVHAGLPFKLRWDEKGKVKKFGERLAGFVNSVTGGLLDAGDWLMGCDSYVNTTLARL